jgi:hypothetical protein
MRRGNVSPTDHPWQLPAAAVLLQRVLAPSYDVQPLLELQQKCHHWDCKDWKDKSGKLRAHRNHPSSHAQADTEAPMEASGTFPKATFFPASKASLS